MPDGIAVVGLSCLFPGAATPAAFWQNLLAGLDSTSLATARELGVDPAELFDPEPGKADKTYWLRGGYVRNFAGESGDDTRGVRPGWPGPSPEGLDEPARWTLRLAREALADAGLAADSQVLERSGLVLGNLSFPTRATQRAANELYREAVQSSLREIFPDRDIKLPEIGPADPTAAWASTITEAPAATAARLLSLGGPRFCLDAACASSLYALRLACDYLGAGDADVMLAGAVSCADPFFVNMGFSIFRAYPQGCESRPLDRASGGLIAGEGGGLLALKRLADARRDGDRIYAVIRGIGLSNDGRGRHVLVPNSKGQVEAMRRAYEAAGVSPDGVQYVECHATGTPLGDAVELDSLDAMFGSLANPPLLGSVKSNLGHLLTAAGAAGLIKVILSMANGRIPATRGVDRPLQSAGARIGGEQIVREPRPWPDAPRRRAAVSAFGFGGTNAHAILEQPSLEPAASEPSPWLKRERLAVVGLAAHFGSCADIDALSTALFDGRQLFGPLPPARWKGLNSRPQLLERLGLPHDRAPLGAYVGDFALDFLRFGLPPADQDQPIAQQTLLLSVAERAIRDAGLPEGANVAVIVGMETELELHRHRGRTDLGRQALEGLSRAGIELNEDEREQLAGAIKDALLDPSSVNAYVSFIGNIMASRVAAAWNFTGPAFTVTADDRSAMAALDAAQLLLSRGDVEAAVVAAVDLGGGLESVLLRHRLEPIAAGATTLSLDREANGWLPGEGAGAIVLKGAGDTAPGQRVYATVEGLGWAPPAADASGLAARQALERAACEARDVGYVELSAAGQAELDERELSGLAGVFRAGAAAPLACAVGSVKANLGHTHAAAGMAALIRTILCLHERYIPGTPGWHGPAAPDVWERSAFYVAEESRPWLTTPEQPRLLAGVSVLGRDGSASHCILAAAPAASPLTSPYLDESPAQLLAIRGTSPEGLLAELDRLERDVSDGGDWSALAQRWTPQKTGPGLTLALVAGSTAELTREIGRARQGVPAAAASSSEWSSPSGSWFTPAPLNGPGRLAFVYSGGLSSYLGLGRQILRAFPFLRDRLYQLTADPGEILGEQRLYPRRLSAILPDEAEELQAALVEDAFAAGASGATFALLTTTVLREVIGLRPDKAFGFSLGEASMLASLDVWDRPTLVESTRAATDRLRARLCGPKEAARDFWAIDVAGGQQGFWATYLLLANPDQVAAALEDEPRVFMTIVATPGEVFIAGDPDGCRRTIDRLGCGFAPAPFNYVLHAPPAESEMAALSSMYTLPAAPSSVAFYTADGYQRLALEPDSIGASVGRTVCSQLDFPRLVRTVYDDGARLFVELGPGSTCSRWIRTTLGSAPHAVIPVDQKGLDSRTALVRALARLLSHGVDVDLSAFAPAHRAATVSSSRGSHVRTVTAGGPDLHQRIAGSPALRQIAARVNQPAPVSTPASVTRPALPVMERPAAGTALLPALSLPALESGAALQGSFLTLQRDASRAAGAYLRAQLDELTRALDEAESQPSPALSIAAAAAALPAAPAGLPAPSRSSEVIWGPAELAEFAGGSIARVFGPAYAPIDTYRRRVRLPLDPYLLVSRVTRLTGRTGELKPSTITTEYDVPKGSWYAVDGQIPWAVAVESGQCDLLLISYLGVDLQNRGERVYRLLDCTLNFLKPLPREGETLRYDISINSFARNGDTLLFFFSYRCYVRDELVLTMDGGCAGFFTDEELAEGAGVILTDQERAAVEHAQKRTFRPPLTAEARHYGPDDLAALSDGHPERVFGAAHDKHGRNPSLRLPPAMLRMFDRVVSVDPSGGAWGLGELVAEKDLQPDDWYFPCHFQGDQVLAGSLMAEGCVQLLQFYLLFLGMHTRTRNARFQPVMGLPQVVRCRGQVTPAHSRLTYRMTLTDIGLDAEPYAIANVEIWVDGKMVVLFKDLGVKLAEDGVSPLEQGLAVSDSRAPFNERHIESFATGRVADCFGPEYELYDGRAVPRQPNGQLKLISRVVELEGRPGDTQAPASLVAEYDCPAQPWFCGVSGEPRYSAWMELALQPCGFLSAWLGSTLASPREDFHFRNLDGQGNLSRPVDVRGRRLRNRVRLLTSTAMDGIIIQSFAFDLSLNGQSVFRGEASFGYFNDDALANQLGLDGGKQTGAWLSGEDAQTIELPLASSDSRLAYPRQIAEPRVDRLGLLDRVVVAPTGGAFGIGYAFGEKEVDRFDWFFANHFYQDPVMPGSLGVEAMLQALACWAREAGPAGGQPVVCPPAGGVTTVWKYRGQIVPDHRIMSLEAHVKRVEAGAGGWLILADGSLWRDGLRIYQVTDLALLVRAQE